jgi:hypothetical protein
MLLGALLPGTEATWPQLSLAAIGMFSASLQASTGDPERWLVSGFSGSGGEINVAG